MNARVIRNKHAENFRKNMSSVYPVNEQCIKTVSFCYGDVLCGVVLFLP